MDIKEERAPEEEQQFIPSAQADNYAESKLTSLKKFVNEPKFEFSLACKDLVAPTRDRKLNTFVQITVVHPGEQNQTRYASTEIVEGTKDPLFLTGVTFPPDYPIYEETKIKLTVYDVKDKSQDTVRTSILAENKDPRTDSGRSFLGSATFKVGELVKSEEQQLTLSLRSLDGGKTFGTIDVRFINMRKTEDGESNQITTDGKEQKVRTQCALVYSCSSPENIIKKDNLPLLNAVLKNPICKLYTFPTSDNKWMYIREQMFESNLSFHIPKELITLHIKEDLRRNQDLKELGELSPHWDNMRKNVIAHCDQMLILYQNMLAELGKYTGSSFKSSCSKGEKTLEFVPINLHLQRMLVQGPCIKDVLYDVITVGAPAAHFQGFKNGGLQKLLNKFEAERRNTGYQCIYYSPENTAKAREVLSNINQLQPLISSHADMLLNSARQQLPESLKNSLKMLSETDRVWANVGKSLTCIIAMVDRLIEKNTPSISKENEKEPSSASHISGDWYEQLYPLTVTLNDCIGEVVTRAKESMSFVLLQELACCLPQCLMLTLRRDIVFSQALAGLICGFIIKLHSSLRDQGFLQQLHTVGLIVQYEGLLSTYSDEIGMLEDMAVGISDLQKVMFKITETKSDDLLPVITGRREHYIIEIKLPEKMFELLPQEIKDGKLLYVYPVLFNVGINEQQTLAERFGDTSLQESLNQENLELLKEYYKLLMEKMPPDCLPHFQEQNDLKGLLENLHQNIQTKKRKNVEIMWLAATICRKLNGVRFTCCKSAKDRTSMSVTLEQCSILRDEHQLHKDFFIRALDCMRRYVLNLHCL
ncbi:inositol polyphosphate 4-phosphatase type II isoform X3 [Ahaetulla prasina]|uniref:inositol polyphosphate 4-phosphatase type II isoform X3 n=1 Tax=Ahaetulla prasina TaxID=499056 RepID=UPI0026492DF2|nr:inositol polyphosphate 4-phosphatase type II isoform X3 [Ahaetulla prasina]